MGVKVYGVMVKLMVKQDIMFFLSGAIIILSLCDTNSSLSSSHLRHIVKERLYRRNVEEVALEIIFKDPCIISKVVSILDIHNFRAIVSRGQIEFEKSLSRCNGIITDNIIKSVAVIQGDETNYENLKQNLLQFLSRDVPCYIVMCTMACTSFIMSLAHTLGFASGIYVWILIGQPAFKDELKYPKKWVGINFKHESVSDAKLSFTDFNKSSTYKVMNRANCHDIQLITSQNERFWFQYPKLYAYTTKGGSSGSNDPEMVPCSCIQSPKLNLIKFFKREEIKVTMIGNAFGYYRSEFLDRSRLACKYGLLCWVNPSGNRSRGDKREPTCCQGLPMDILSKLEKDLNVNMYLYQVADGTYGSNVNGSWSGMIGEVVSGKADMAGDYFSVTEARLSAVDYADNFHLTDMVLASKMQLSKLQLLNIEIFSFLSPGFWAFIFSTTFIASAIVYWSERFICGGYGHDSWIQSFIYAIGLLVQRDVGGSLPRYLGTRTISIALAIAMMVTMTTYVAVLAAKNITTKKTLPISGLSDQKVITPTPKFKIATWKDSSYSQMFETNKDPIWSNLGQFMKPYNFDSLPDITRQMKNGTCQAIVTNTLALTIMRKMYDGCDIQFKEVITQDPMTFVLTKGSYWTSPISNLIQIYMESGKLASFEHKWLSSKCAETVGISQKFGMLYLSGACCMIVFGVLVSGIVFILEHIYFAKQDRRRSSYSFNPT